jgi:hypothetical protein
MLYQLSYEVKSLRVHDISELSLVPSISICFYDLEFKQTDQSSRVRLSAQYQKQVYW